MLGEERDIIALAQTGTGKTAAFGLPLVQATDTELNEVQSLILCPTRELCMQITNDLSDYSKYTYNCCHTRQIDRPYRTRCSKA
jgi:ATP-dependent RNA helicase DeaD